MSAKSRSRVTTSRSCLPANGSDVGIGSATQLLVGHGQRVMSRLGQHRRHFGRHVFIDLEPGHQAAPLGRETVRSRASSAAYSIEA